MSRLKDDIAIDKDRAMHRKYCSCGHSITFPDYSKTNKILCTYCGHYIYKNKKEEFKDRLFLNMKKSVNK